MVNTKYWTNWPSRTSAQVHAHVLAELLADDEHRHAHAVCARQRRSAARHACDTDTPPGASPGGVLVGSPEAARRPVARYLARKVVIYLLTFFVAVTIDWAIPRFMPGDPIEGSLAHARPAGRTEAADRLLHPGVRLRRPLWQQYPNFGRAPPRRPRAGASRLPTPSPNCHGGRCRTPWRCGPRDPAQLLAGNKVARLAARRNARQHRASGESTFSPLRPQMCS
jgi:hypothetical protein